MATYDTYLTAGISGVLSLGLKAHSAVPVTDTAATGDNAGVLGDVPSDAFRSPTGLLGANVTYTYLGTVSDPSGRAVGFVASSGPLSALAYTVFVPTGVDPTTLSLTLLPRSGIDATQWDLDRAAALDLTAPGAPAIGAVIDNAGMVAGGVSVGAATDDATPTARISLSGTGAVSGDTVRLLADGVQVGSVVLADTDIARGSVEVTASALPGDGPHLLTSVIVDIAGNVSVPAAGFSLVLDTTPPAAGATVTLSNPGGDGIQLGEANEYAFEVSGVAGGTATVTFASDGGGAPLVVQGLANGAYTVDLGSLPSGRVSARIVVSDEVGNRTAGVGGEIGAVICFMADTLIATPEGPAAVETLSIGDLVLTAEGRAEPVRWVGRQTVSTVFADPLRVLPIRVRAGALGGNLPLRDLLVSPDHALMLDGVLVQAGALLNGTTISREAAVPTVFTYYHVELADHSLLLAEGVPAETFVDNAERMAFDNWAEHAALYGTGTPLAEMDVPRAKSARQLPSALRRRLQLHASAILDLDAAA